MAEPNEDAVALKYLDFARGEILERIKLSNQFLIVYLGGISALIGWFFSGNGGKGGISPQDALPAVAAGLSFLACAFSWILSENERMIEFLARYQREELRKWAKQFSFEMWENSTQLNTENPSTGAMVAHIMIINAPNAALILLSIFTASMQSHPRIRMGLIVTAMVLSLFSCGVSLKMVRRRKAHRKTDAEKPPHTVDRGGRFAAGADESEVSGAD